MGQSAQQLVDREMPEEYLTGKPGPKTTSFVVFLGDECVFGGSKAEGVVAAVEALRQRTAAFLTEDGDFGGRSFRGPEKITKGRWP
jgi:hypothetical protein